MRVCNNLAKNIRRTLSKWMFTSVCYISGHGKIYCVTCGNSDTCDCRRVGVADIVGHLVGDKGDDEEEECDADVVNPLHRITADRSAHVERRGPASSRTRPPL